MKVVDIKTTEDDLDYISARIAIVYFILSILETLI